MEQEGKMAQPNSQELYVYRAIIRIGEHVRDSLSFHCRPINQKLLNCAVV